MTTMQHIDDRRQHLAGHDFLAFVADRGVRPADRLAFAPCLAPFVMGFSDVNVFCLRDESGAGDQFQELANAHSYEDAGHWPMYLDDLDVLGHNSTIDTATVLRRLWDPELARTRQLTYGLAALCSAATSRQRIALIEAIEATGYVAWKAFLIAAEDYAAETGRTLRYFGPEHAALETGHAIGAEDIDRELRQLVFTGEERSEVLAMIDEVFALFAAMMDEQLAYARAHTGAPALA